SIVLQKKYYYTHNNISSGILFGSPIRRENNYYKEIHKIHGTISFPLQFASGSRVLYSTVIEENIDNIKNISNKTEYYFNHDLGEVGESNAIYRQSTPNFNWRLNKNSNVETYLGNNLIKSISYEHSIKNFELNSEYGIRIRPKNKIYFGNAGTNIFYYTDYEYEYYPFYTEFPYLKKEITKEYLSGGTVTTETNYVYGGAKHNQLTEESTTNSKGETIKKTYKYVPDYNAASTTILGKMEAKNMIVPIETKVFNGATPISEQKTDYFEPYTGIILPQYVYEKKGSGIATTDRKIMYNNYDTQGNLTEYTLENGIPVSIIWGYGGQYPVAKLEGVSLSQISAATITTLNTKTTDADLLEAITALRTAHKDAMVTGYLYKPLVGVTQIIQPNGVAEKYNYDSSNRLQSIVNDKGEMLKTFQYNYKP
ncbi:hypothetical protein N5D03_13935, partial [Empedobacter sp. GD03861]|nr:hypothetical protein [Empedobacter sp. GD03861]